MNRLRFYFLAFFLLLAVPCAILLSRTYDNLRQESFFFYRKAAEGTVSGLHQKIQQNLAREERRPYTQYRYIHIADQPVPEREGLSLSPLAIFPVQSEIPGILGYFQIDPDGSFHTPLLPGEESPLNTEVPDLQNRVQLRDQMASLLDGEMFLLSNTERADKLASDDSLIALEESLESTVDQRLESDYYREATVGSPADYGVLSRSGSPDPPSRQLQQNTLAQATVFDAEMRKTKGDQQAGQKQESASPKAVASSRPVGIDSREAVVFAEGRSVDAPRLRDRSDRESAGETDSYLQVTAEVDPFRIKQLDSRWVAFYRKVWWSERRYVQGFVVDIQEYLKAQLTADLENSALPEHAAYLVFYRGVPLAPFSKGEASTSKPLLLFRSVLPHPLSQFQLALTVAELPKGPGYQVVNLLAVFLTVLVIGGVIGMYRLTATQLELSQKKSDFVAAVSHELRTPLASLRLYGEMLVEGWVQDEEKKRDYYRHIHEESERLSRLIQNVLRLSELERNEWHVKMEACDPVRLVEGVVERVRKQIERAGFEVVITVEGNPQRFQTDVDAVTQILINLIDNAIKFSKDSETRKLILTISQESDDCSLRVRDFGPGIPKRQIKKVFERFYRVDSEMTRGTRGTGIGLAMVKMLADAMQARVDVVNRQPGVEVSVCFPTSGEKTPS